MHNNMLTRHELIGARRRAPIKEGRMITDFIASCFAIIEKVLPNV